MKNKIAKFMATTSAVLPTWGNSDSGARDCVVIALPSGVSR